MVSYVDLFLRGSATDRDRHIKEREFFASLWLDNRVSKMTWDGRLDDVVSVFVEALTARGESMEVLDVGISSGASTVELLTHLRTKARQATVVGIDYCLYGYHASVAPGVSVLVQPNGHPLQYVVLGTPFRSWSRRRYWPFGWPFVLGAARRLLRSRMLRLGLMRVATDGHVSVDTDRMTRIALLRPSVLENPHISCLEMDVLHSSPAEFVGRFDGIRAANVLSRLAFTEAELSHMLRQLARWLKPGIGVLSISRSHADGTNHGTILRADLDGRLSVVARIGTGSDIETLATRSMG